MILFDWLCALVALLTALAMLKDTPTGADLRDELRMIFAQNLAAYGAGGWRSIDRADLGAVLRFALRLLALVAVVSCAGAAVMWPPWLAIAFPSERVLRCALCIFLALQAPCPWWRYIAHGHPRASRLSIRSPRRHVH
ncbi:hypothetical protein [Lysobacter sp. CA199]|uniref:hypothetical protein n=1 Tax=Lysobacter sp. CA199 TaxID=3455608 RepID=UPI003F8D8B53